MRSPRRDLLKKLLAAAIAQCIVSFKASHPETAVKEDQDGQTQRLLAGVRPLATTPRLCADPPAQERKSRGGALTHSLSPSCSLLQDALDAFDGAPFTLQRMCELIAAPGLHYGTLRKLLYSFERLLSVSSTIEVAAAATAQQPDAPAAEMEASAEPMDTA